MPFAAEMQISLRHLSAKKAGFVSLTTWISVIGIALGVAILIVVVGVMTGFQREIRIKLLGTQSHIEVYKIGSGSMGKWREVVSYIQDVPEIVAASPFVFGQVMLTSRTGVTGAIVRGIDPSREINVTDIDKYIRSGSLEKLNSPDSKIASDRKQESEMPLAGLVIGEVLATILGANVGDEVTMVSPVGVVTPAGMLPLTRRFKVVGTFRSGFYQFDSGMAFMSIKDAQDFFGLKDGVSGIHARVHDIFAAEKVANQLQKGLKNLEKTQGPYWARSWQRMNVNLFSALKTERTTMFILLLLVIIVAAFNIVGSLIMVVMEKGKEIAILISMGATRGAILRIFFIQGA
ncbi:MAG: ABC transporter permease, partial [Candidatus Thermoplasmatota archaeon]|nr:ABC transporter permease [Candidatus Thermoplasmatota archaeon]